MARLLALRRFSGPVPTPRRGGGVRRGRASRAAGQTLPSGRRAMLYPTRPQRAVLRRHAAHRTIAPLRLAAIRRPLPKTRAATVARRALAAKPTLLAALRRRPLTQRRLLAQLRKLSFREVASPSRR